MTAGVVLSGCASADGGDETTTSPTVTENPGNPWDLPIEQRPALFDPCAEIPIEAIEEGVGAKVDPNSSLTRHEPGSLMACGWTNEQVHVTAAASWKSRAQFLNDKSLRQVEQGGRRMRMVEVGDQTGSTCLQLFFTSRGATWIKVDVVNGLGEFRGNRFVEACDALDQAIAPLLKFVPEGDFK
ncbi:DUF3558 domain-containing protein [Dietzia sp. B32]|uniref:DUF3558 domain-containing protein n=1 Tax=Dietzia sp. B32 TaxID=2915130 RepID=UPI0021ADA37A|nr:DUF3558 domain-containing protein [Dietzia sp. B32]UVE96512.1 DUF3558 domain-containing protein [Dietzia sp. B32]